MIVDSNSMVSTLGNIVNASVGGDMVFFGLIFLLLIAFVFVKGRIKAGPALGIGAFISFVLMVNTPLFAPLYWFLMVILVLVLIQAVRMYQTKQN